MFTYFIYLVTEPELTVGNINNIKLLNIPLAKM